MKKTLIVTLSLVLLAAGGAGAQTGHGPGPGPGGMGHGGLDAHLEHMAAMLDLTPDQVGQVREIITEGHATAEVSRDELRVARQALDSLIHSTQFDEAAIRAAAATIAGIEADLAVDRARTFQRAQQVLTPEQAEKLEQFLQMRSQPGHGGHGHWEMHGHGTGHD